MTTEENQNKSSEFSRRTFLKGLGIGLGGLAVGGGLARIFTGKSKSGNNETSTYHSDPPKPVATSEVNTEGSPGLNPETITQDELKEHVKWALMFLRGKVDNQDNTTINHLVSVLQQILTSENALSYKLADGRVVSRSRVLVNSNDGSAPKPIEYKINLRLNNKIKEQTFLDIFCCYYGTTPIKKEVDDNLPGMEYDNLSIVFSIDGLNCYSLDSDSPDYPHEFKSEAELKYLIGRTANDLLNGKELPLKLE